VGWPSLNDRKRAAAVSGSHRVFPEMWQIVKNLVSGSLVVSIEDIAKAVKKLIIDMKIIAEGAGAASVAAAVNNANLGKKIVCVVSGGSIDSHKLITILQDGIP